MKTGILTQADLVALTSYSRGAEQMTALKKMGLRPFQGRDGHPRVTWEAVNAAMTETKPQTNGINWRGVNAAA